MRPTQIRWSKQRTNTLYFRDSTGHLRYARLSFGGDSYTIPFQAKMTIRRDEEFAEMFEQSWRGLSENFYDPKFHGADWNAVRTSIGRWSSTSPSRKTSTPSSA